MGVRLHGRAAVLRFALAFVLLCAASVVYGKDDFAKLKSGEGLLLLVVENDIGASSIRVDGAGFFADDLAKIGNGLNVYLMRFPAGQYRWSKVSKPWLWGSGYYDLSRDTEFTFRVEAGVINYPGDFLMRPLATNYSTFNRTNRMSLAMARLDRKYPGVRTRFPWRTDVLTADPFATFFAEHVPAERQPALSDSSDVDAKKASQREIPEDFVKLFDELYSDFAVESPRISPSGDIVAYAQSRGGTADVIVVDRAAGESHTLFRVKGSIDRLEWGGDRTLLIEYGFAPASVVIEGKLIELPLVSAGGLEIVRFGDGPVNEKSIERVKIPDASLIDAMPGDESHLIVSRVGKSGESRVYAVDKRMRKFQAGDFGPRARIDSGLDNALSVFVDRAGRLAAAIAVVGKGESAARVLTVRRDGEWKAVRRLPEDEYLLPFMLNEGGTHLVALTNIARDQAELVQVSLDNGEIDATLASVPGFDIAAPILRRHDRALLGFTVLRAGTPQANYLHAADGRVAAAIVENFPGAQAILLDESRDRRYAVVSVYSETNPGTYYLYDSTKKSLEKLVDSLPEFKVAKPAESKAFTARSADGLQIDGFLTLPTVGAQPYPVVVMPHGGPIGIADTRTFAPDVQILANRGFAVLRVNYRGSSGAGKRFLELGHGQWGREIEQDVEQALDHAMAAFPLDRSRVALFGSSYGGYSTLMGLIRAPERFRCGVAVSAVTDLPLLFSSSDWNRRETSMSRMKRIVGDPDTAMDELKAYSPTYQYTRIKQPLLLIHGTNDARVSFEHAWRLRTLLANADRPPTWLPIWGGDHSLSRPKDQLAVRAAADNFLRECLATPAATAAAGGSPTGSGL